jgi:hypothetical protein
MRDMPGKSWYKCLCLAAQNSTHKSFKKGKRVTKILALAAVR